MSSKTTLKNSKIHVTHLIDPQNFWAQIGTEKSLADFESFEEALAAYSQQTSEFDPGEDVYVGQLVLAKCADVWQRARVVVIDCANEEVDVLFVDRGSTEIVPRQNIYSDLPEQVEGIPPQAYHCKLAGVKPLGSRWSSRAVNRFRELVLDQILDCKIHERELGIVSIDIMKNDGQSVADTLLDEEVAISSATIESCVPRRTEDTMSVIPSFNLDLLSRKHQPRRKTPEKKSPRLGVQEDFHKDAEEANAGHVWERSDMTIGEDYQPNTSPNIIMDIADQIRGLTDNRSQLTHSGTGRSEDASHRSPNQSIRDSSYGGKQVGQRSNKVKVTTKETEVRSGFSRSCDAPQFLINSDMLSIKSQLLKVEESWEEPVLRKPYVKKIPWKEQIENEYEWQSLQFKRKAKKVLEEAKSGAELGGVITQLKGMVYPAKSTLDNLPGPKELDLLIDLLTDIAIECYDSFCHVALNIMAAFQGHADFADVISNAIWSHQREYVKFSWFVRRKTYSEIVCDTSHFPQLESQWHQNHSLGRDTIPFTLSPGGQELCHNYCKFLGKLFIKATQWNESSHMSVNACVNETIHHWLEVDSKVEPPATEELRISCLALLLGTCGETMEVTLPSELRHIFSDIRQKLLNEETSRIIREKLLDLMLLRAGGWKSEYSEGKLKISDDRLESPMEHRNNQPSEKAADGDVCDIEGVCVEDPSVATSRSVCSSSSSLSSLMSADSWDPFCQVKLMLARLKLEELFEHFLSNGIRDPVLELDKGDLRILLKECGFLPGHILEITTYLDKEGQERPYKVRLEEDQGNSSTKLVAHSQCTFPRQTRPEKSPGHQDSIVFHGKRNIPIKNSVGVSPPSASHSKSEPLSKRYPKPGTELVDDLEPRLLPSRDAKKSVRKLAGSLDKVVPTEAVKLDQRNMAAKRANAIWGLETVKKPSIKVAGQMSTTKSSGVNESQMSGEDKSKLVSKGSSSVKTQKRINVETIKGIIENWIGDREGDLDIPESPQQKSYTMVVKSGSSKVVPKKGAPPILPVCDGGNGECHDAFCSCRGTDDNKEESKRPKSTTPTKDSITIHSKSLGSFPRTDSSSSGSDLEQYPSLQEAANPVKAKELLSIERKPKPAFGGTRKCTLCGDKKHLIYDCPSKREKFFIS